jgi:hypothetical protein
MLGTTLWFVLAIGVLAGALLNGAAAFARAGVQAAADHAVESAMHDAVADYQNALQTAIAQSAAPLAPSEPFTGSAPSLDGYAHALAALPNPLQRTFPPSEQIAQTGPRFTLAYTVTPTTLAAPHCPQLGTVPASQGPDAIAWLQCGGFVQESRISLHVVVNVLDAAGAQTFARRDQYVTLRLFAEPPYSALVGRKDGAAPGDTDSSGASPSAAPHEGDLGGGTISGASPPPAASPWPSGGTLIHVRYECVDGAGHCANAAPPDPDADLRAGTRWANGNQPAP